MSVQALDATVRLGVDTTMIEAEIAETIQDTDKAKIEIRKSLNAALTATRSAIQFTGMFLQASGAVVDQTLLSVSEAVVLSAEALIGIATAESLTLVGVLTAGIKLAAAGALLLQVHAINRGRTEISTRLGAASAGLRGLSSVM